MKTTTSSMHRAHATRLQARAGKTLKLAALVCTAVAFNQPVRAEQVYWATAELLAEFFPASHRVTYAEIDLDDEDVEVVESATGQPLHRRNWIIFIALSRSGDVEGYAVFDEEPGQHQPITFAVQLDTRGYVQRQELVIYREPYGEGIRLSRFREQFVGRGPGDSMSDVAVVTGATISSASIRTGVRRVVEVVAVVLRSQQEVLR